jgi:hypothetical protein
MIQDHLFGDRLLQLEKEKKVKPVSKALLT